MQKGGPWKFLRSEKGGPEKKNTNFTPEKWVYMIFCGVDAYFPCQKRGAPKNFEVQKGGPENFSLQIFFLHQAPPDKCLWTVPYGWEKCQSRDF